MLWSGGSIEKKWIVIFTRYILLEKCDNSKVIVRNTIKIVKITTFYEIYFYNFKIAQFSFIKNSKNLYSFFSMRVLFCHQTHIYICYG